MTEPATASQTLARLKKMSAVAGVLVLYLVVFDVAVVAISFLLDIAPIRHKSTPLFYAIWFVAGVFCGFIVYLTGGGILSSDSRGDWTDGEDAGPTGVLVILCMSVVLATLSILGYVFLWRGSTNSSERDTVAALRRDFGTR